MTGNAKMGEERIAILGGRGMLGTDLVNACAQHGFDFEIFDLPKFDITNTRQLKDVAGGARFIINCAAYTNVDGAESQADLAYKVNAEAVSSLGRFAKDAGKWVLHISTDFVFDGKLDRPYCETDEPNPINTYGKTKLAGEKLLAESGCKYCIMRVEWTYGQAGQNFVGKLITRAGKDGILYVVDDQIGSPTATSEIAEAICQLLPRRPTGLFHFAASGDGSRFDRARFIFSKLRMPVNVIGCKTERFTSPAKRPLNSRFDCRKIQHLLDKPIKFWQLPLELFLEQL